MIIYQDESLWYAIHRGAEQVCMGFGPTMEEAMKYCAELMNKARNEK